MRKIDESGRVVNRSFAGKVGWGEVVSHLVELLGL